MDPEDLKPSKSSEPIVPNTQPVGVSNEPPKAPSPTSAPSNQFRPNMAEPAAQTESINLANPQPQPIEPVLGSQTAKKPKSKKLLVIILAVVLVIAIVVAGFLLLMPKSGTSNKSDPATPGPDVNSEQSKTTQTQGNTTSTASNFTTTTTETGVPTQETVNNDVLSQIAAIETKAGNKVEAKDVGITSKALASSEGNNLVEQWNVTVNGKAAVYMVTIGVDGGKQSFKVEKKS